MNRFPLLSEEVKKEIDKKYSKSQVLKQESTLDMTQGVDRFTLDEMKGEDYWINKNAFHYMHYQILGITLTPLVIKAYLVGAGICVVLSFISS